MKTILTKMCGAGNDFLIADENQFSQNFKEDLSKIISQIPKLCDRKFGIGADGFCLLSFGSKIADLKWEFFNSDGSRASMCGNAACCITHYALTKKLVQKTPFTFEIQKQVLKGEIKNNQPWIQTPTPQHIKTAYSSFEDLKNISIHYINSGVLHLLINKSHLNFENTGNLQKFAQKLRKENPDANITFFKQINSEITSAQTFERGVEDFTLACGTGALAVASLLKVKDSTHKIKMPGGTLTVTFKNNQSQLHSPIQWIAEISPFL